MSDIKIKTSSDVNVKSNSEKDFNELMNSTDSDDDMFNKFDSQPKTASSILNISKIKEKVFTVPARVFKGESSKQGSKSVSKPKKRTKAGKFFTQQDNHYHFSNSDFSYVSDHQTQTQTQNHNVWRKKETCSKKNAATQSFTPSSFVMNRNTVSFNVNQTTSGVSTFMRNDCVRKIQKISHKHHVYENKQNEPTFTFHWVPNKVTTLVWVPKATNQTGPKFKWVPKVT